LSKLVPIECFFLYHLTVHFTHNLLTFIM